MVLIHQAALAVLRQESIDVLGMETARGVLTRFGHTSGATDAALARRAKPDADPNETFQAGPRLHAIEGVAASDPIGFVVEPKTGYHVGEWIWRNSVEAEAHLASLGLAAEPVCWMAIGYASAYTSAFMGRPILYREVECRATGAPHCRIVGKPAEEWAAEVRDDLHHGFDLDGSARDTLSEWANVIGEGSSSSWIGDRLVGASPGFVSVTHMIGRVARTDAPLLLVGEPGVGKKSFARVIHKLSGRAAKPLVSFNCAALSGEQLDAELFGFEKGAVAAAVASRSGRIERANGSTLFLEDVHCLDLRAQTKLLHALQNGEIERVGGTQPRSVNLRLIAATNDRLVDAVRNGGFREDLYYRLAMFPITVPPLRERRTDLPLLIRHFIDMHARRHGRTISGLSDAAVGYLLSYDFPGNIAELESMIERAVILASENGVLDVTTLAASIDAKPHFLGLSERGLLIPLGGSDPRHDDGALDRLLASDFDLESFERQLIDRAVAQADGNLSRAAKQLGLTRAQLAYRYRRGQDDEA